MQTDWNKKSGGGRRFGISRSRKALADISDSCNSSDVPVFFVHYVTITAELTFPNALAHRL